MGFFIAVQSNTKSAGINISNKDNKRVIPVDEKRNTNGVEFN